MGGRCDGQPKVGPKCTSRQAGFVRKLRQPRELEKAALILLTAGLVAQAGLTAIDIRWRNGPPQGFGFAAEWSSPRMMVS